MREIIRDKGFWLIFLTAAALRIWHLYFASLSPTFWAPAVDPLWYHQAAQRVASGDFGPWPLFRAPLYPWLLGLVYAMVENDLLWARLLNLFLQLATVALIYSVCRNYFGATVARIASILFAVNGMAIFYTAEILATSLEMLVAVLAVWSTLALQKAPTVRQAAVCGLLWGIAAITRPNFLLVAPFALLIALWPLWRSRPWKIALAAVVGLAIPIAPVTLANYMLGQEPVLIATQGGVNFWIGNNPEADGVSSVLPGADRFWTLEQASVMADRANGRHLRPGEMSDYYLEKGRQYLVNHPADAAKLILRKTLLFFNRFEVSNNKHIAFFSSQTPGLRWLILLNFALLLPLAVLALWSRFARESRLIWGVSAVYAVSVILFFVASRFRMDIVPWLCILSGLGVASWKTISANRKPSAVVAAVAVLILALINPYSAREANIGAGHYMEGNAYLALDSLEQARTSFQLAQTDPGSRELALLNLGVVEQRLNNLSAARSALQELTSQFPRSAKGWNNLGVIEELQKDTIAAFHAYERALDEDTSSNDARENLARLRLEEGKRLLRDGDFAQAQFPLTKSILLLPSASAYYHLALAQGQSAQFQSALENLNRALHLNPSYQPALTLLKQLQADGQAPAPEPR